VNVLFVQRQPCIRALKYAEGSRAAHRDIRLSFAYQNSTLNELYGHGDECFAEWFRLGPEPAASLQEIVATREIDVIHCHNGPDTLTNLCIDLFRDQIPIVHDVHDLMSARETAYDDVREPTHADGGRNAPNRHLAPQVWREEEQRAMELSDAVIAVSDEILEVAQRRGYKLPPLAETYANYIPERFIPTELPEAETDDDTGPPRVVYEGSLKTDGGHYDLREIFQALAREGLEVHIYPSRDDPAYAALARTSPGIVYHEHVAPEQLYRELPRYDVGWAGFNDALNIAHLETVLPNKLFEYIACGLPVVSFRHRALASFITTHSVGLVVDDVRGLGKALRGPEMASLRAKARAQRREFTVEANIGRIVSIYERLAVAQAEPKPSGA